MKHSTVSAAPVSPAPAPQSAPAPAQPQTNIWWIYAAEFGLRDLV